MTIAICLNCGTQKVGAFTRCPGCSYDPAVEPDRRRQAQCLALSDHYLKPDALLKLSQQLKAKVAIPWDEPLLDSLVHQLETQQNPLLKAPIGCSYIVWGLIALMLGLLALVIFLFSQRPA